MEDKSEPELNLTPDQPAQPFVMPNMASQAMVMVQQSTIQSPYLPPEFLERYEALLPGTAAKIFEMAQEQQKFAMEVKRHEMSINSENLARTAKIDDANIAEQKEVSKNRARELRIREKGQYFALLVFFVAIASAIFFGCIHMQWAAVTSLGIIIGAMTVLFLQKPSQPIAEVEEKTVDSDN